MRETDLLPGYASPYLDGRPLHIDRPLTPESFTSEETTSALESPWLSDEILASPLVSEEVWSKSSEQVAFRERVLRAHLERKLRQRGKPQRDLRPEELRNVPGTNIKMRADAAEAAGRLLEAANQALLVARKAGDLDALRTTRITGTSGYRNREYQHNRWIELFPKYYDRTRKAREGLAAGPHSDEAVPYVLKRLGIGAPGYSNHQGGIAIDLSQERTRGHKISNDTDPDWRERWRQTWLHKWLRNHAASFGFVPLAIEEWHWDFKPEEASKLTGGQSLDETEYDIETEGLEEMSGDPDPFSEAGQTLDEDELDSQQSPFLSNELDRDFAESSEQGEAEETANPTVSGLFTFTARMLPVKVAVLVTQAARRAKAVEVLVYAHGLDLCKPVFGQRPTTFITEGPFKLGDLAEASGRPIVLVVPFLDWEHLAQKGMMFGRKWHALSKPENLNGVTAEVLERAAALTGTGRAPALSRLILAGHSRAYGFFDALASARADPQMAQGALARLSHVWALDTAYHRSDPAWMAWLRSRENLTITVIYRYGKSRNRKTGKTEPLSTGVHGDKFLPLVGKSNGRLSVIRVASGKVGHCAIPNEYLPDLLASLPAISRTAEEEFDTDTDDGQSESWAEGLSTEAAALDEEETVHQYGETEDWDEEADDLDVTDEEETPLESFAAFADSVNEEEEWKATDGEELSTDGAAYEVEEVEEELEEDLEEVDEEAEVLEASGLTPAELKAVQITSTFETGHRGGFYGLSGNFDGQGISFGLVNWNIGTGSLQPLLRDFATEEPQRWKTVFGPDAASFSTLIAPKDKAAQAAQLRFAIEAMNVPITVNGKRKWLVKEPWVTYFKRLSEDPAFQRIQVRYVRNLLDRARYFCEHFGLKSESGFAFMFDAVSSHGKRWLTKKWSGVEKRQQLLRARRTTLEATYGKGTVSERELLLAIADVLAETSSARWADNVRRRKRWFVTGEHPRSKELEGLTPRADAPYLVSASARPAGSPTIASAVSPRSQPLPAPRTASTSRPSSRSSMSGAKRAELIAAAVRQATTAGDEEDRIALASTLRANGTDPASWFGGMVPDATFLGREIRKSGGNVPGVHRKMLDALQSAERTLLEKHPDRTAEQLGNDLGIYDIAGLRPPKKATGKKRPSYHCFGLAVDINNNTNPFVGNMPPKKGMPKYKEYLDDRSPRVIERAMSLLHGEPFDVENMGDRVARVGPAWDIHHRSSETLAEYLRLADDIDGQRLRTLVADAQSRGDTRTLRWWKDRIATDCSVLKHKDWDFQHHKKPHLLGYMDLPRELVVALVGAGLRWGGQFRYAKDIMHFDLAGGPIKQVK